MSIVAAIVAQAATDNAPLLLSYGPLGIMCAWLMYKGEKVFTEIRDLAHRIDGLTKALLVDMANRDTCGIQTKRYAQDAIARIDARAEKD